MAIAVTWALILLAAAGQSRSNPAPLSAPPEPAASGEGPQELIAGLAAQLFALLDRDRGRIRRQPELVLPLVDELLSAHFDAAYTSRLVLGTHWRDAAPEQRQRFASALYRTLLRTYAGAVAEWTPDRLRLLPYRDDTAALQVVVRTEVARPRAPVVPVDYRLHSTIHGWMIFDVVVDGVSYVRTYRDDVDGRSGAPASMRQLRVWKSARPAPLCPLTRDSRIVPLPFLPDWTARIDESCCSILRHPGNRTGVTEIAPRVGASVRPL